MIHIIQRWASKDDCAVGLLETHFLYVNTTNQSIFVVIKYATSGVVRKLDLLYRPQH